MSSLDEVGAELALHRCCYICGKQFMSVEFMWDHISNKHSYYKSTIKYTCTHCGDCKNSIEEIVAHELKTHGFGCACRFCGMTCKNEDTRIDHILTEHLKPKIQLCRACKKEIKPDGIHTCTMTDNLEELGSFDCLKCRYCHNYFIHSDSLYHHVIKDHWQLFTSLCKSCGQLFHSMLALRRHRSDDHNCLDGIKIMVDEKIELKFELPPHADRPNSFIEEMQEIIRSEPENLKKKVPCSKEKKRKPNQIVSESSLHAEMISKSIEKQKEQFEETECLPVKKIRNENDGLNQVPVDNDKPGEEITTVNTDIFNSDILRQKQREILMKCCFICCKIFYNNDTMWDHISTKHSYYIKPKRYSCTHCGITLKTLDKLVSHEFEDHGFGNACLFCGKLLKSEAKKIDHVFAKHLQATRKVCKVCHQVFNSDVEMNKHMKKSHTKGGGSIDCFQCNFCKDLFKNKMTIFNHILKDHWQLFTFLCKSCGQLFHSLQALKHHRSDHKHCLDGTPIPKEEDKYVIKFQLPSHVPKTNTFKEEMDEILGSTS